MVNVPRWGTFVEPGRAVTMTQREGQSGARGPVSNRGFLASQESGIECVIGTRIPVIRFALSLHHDRRPPAGAARRTLGQNPASPP